MTHRTDSSDIRSLLPLRPPVTHILLALTSGVTHGYAIKQDVEERAEGLVKMGPGTLYESLQRMEVSGLIAEADPPELADTDGRPRRFYAITSRGQAALTAELLRMDRLVRHARERDLLPTPA